MDIPCTRCGEPWDMDHCYHEAPEDFEWRGKQILRCPCCTEDNELPKSMQDVFTTIHDVLGDDIDGMASILEDFGLLEDH